MTIGFTDLFTKLGHFFYAGNLANTGGTNAKAEIEDAVQGISSSDPIEQYRAVYPATTAIDAMLNSMAAANGSAVRQPAQNLLIEIVNADTTLARKQASVAITELIRQMVAGSESLDANAVAATPSYGGSNVGTGKLIVSVKRPDGKTNEHALAETITFTRNATSFAYAGEAAQNNKMHPEWPQGSGINGSAPSNSASTSGNLLAGTFETADTIEAHLPAGWIANPATLGTTLKMTSVEVQTVIVSGTPTSGSYTLTFTNRDSDAQTTPPLAFNASSSDVESALQDLLGLGDVSVVTTGTTPNFTHTITFTGVPNPGQLTSANTFDTGSIAHNTSTAGANVAQGARALEFDSNGSQQTAIYYPINALSLQQYAFSTLIRVDSAPAAGVITVDLVDGIGGSVIADDAGTNNSFTIDPTALTSTWVNATGVFRTPSNLPATVYLRFRASTAISNTSSVFVDEMQLRAMTRLYAGGVYATLVDGRTAWVAGDRITLAVTNDRAGAIHEWMNRVFDLRDNDVLFPTSGSETIADTLIA
jgi:hypothetical protein